MAHIKVVEPPPTESLSGSVFLTPDKSIRVNKAQDLFDQLLNSSPARSGSKQAKKGNLFDNLLRQTPKECKTYRRKKPAVKKFNYSSETSESDKENKTTNNENSTQNVTDIKSHELIIEKEAALQPKIDDSINNIVRKLSLIKQISSGSAKKYRSNKNRLTKNPQVVSKGSPLSSTPFNDKTRSKSIYKFSPIPMKELVDSPNCVTINEDEDEINQSIVFVPKFSGTSIKRSQNTDKSPPILHVTDSLNLKNSKPLFSSTEGNLEFSNQHEITREETPSANNLQKLYNDEISTLQISEIEPFLGFSPETVPNIHEKLQEIIEDEYNQSIILSTAKLSKSSHRSKESNSSENDAKVDCSEEKEDESIVNMLAEENALHSQSKSEVNKGNDDNSVINLSETVENEMTYQSLAYNPETEDHQDISDSTNSEDHESSTLDSQGEDKESLYDTCNSESSDRDDRKPVVAIKRMNKSLFQKYYDDKIPNYDDVDEESDSSISGPSDRDDNTREPIVAIQRMNKSLFQKYYNDKIPNYDDVDEEIDSCISGPSDRDDNNREPIVAIQRMNKSLFQRYYGHKIPNYHDGNEESDSCNSESSNKNDNTREPVVAIQRMNNSLFQKYYDDKIPNHQSGNEESNSSNSEASDRDDNTREPVVAIQRINNSLFQKYNDNGHDVNEESINERVSEASTDEYASFANSDEDVSMEESREDTDTDSASSPSISEETTSSENKDVTVQENVDEEDKVSFVTTRRRNDFVNTSEILVLDDSDDSISSTDCDKTVLSKNRISLLDKSRHDTSKEMSETDEEAGGKSDKVCINYNENTSQYGSTSYLEAGRESTSQNTSGSEIRTGIVLQPGKKWERSLSIYRRMTMMNDTSILEEDMHTKGRKYRQSVISTIELQESKGSLHNESIHSRRSTFVSKPSRSTIRIVKETNSSRLSLSSTAVFEDLQSFLEECDDTLCDLSKLSIADDHNVTVLEKFHEANRITTAREYVLRRCNQSDTVLFDECYPDTVLKNCRKIGEGVYGEVFLWRAPDGRARVMKIVPIAGHTKVNGEHQKDFHEIISEIVIAMELSALRAPIPEIECHFDEGKDIDELDLHAVQNATDVFNEVLCVRCVYGGYPSRLLDLWELFDETKGSDNDNPAILPPQQQYVVLELANAGQDLESYQFNSADQAHALFLQVAYALAVGEESFQFEHRDLHWGNVLIAPTDQKYCTFVIRGRAHRVLRRGVAATIIDYSLSRVSLGLGRGEGAALYNELSADDGLFGAVGDYQFQVYRLMRDKLGNDWKNFEPYTNILWLHYTVDKMITALRYKRTNTKIHKQYIAKLKGIKERILNYGSAAQFVLTDNEY